VIVRITWTEPAARALESIQDYIARDKLHAAWEVAQRIRHAVGQLEDHPQLGRAGRVRGTLELVIPGLPYIVPYRIKGKEIQILSVFHTARKWPEEFE
jgi:toxin ParE1/3/4